MHRHRAITRRSRIDGWICPVVREDDPRRNRAADGNVIRTDRCSCGATRRSAHTLAASEYGDWLLPCGHAGWEDCDCK